MLAFFWLSKQPIGETTGPIILCNMPKRVVPQEVPVHTYEVKMITEFLGIEWPKNPNWRFWARIGFSSQNLQMVKSQYLSWIQGDRYEIKPTNRDIVDGPKWDNNKYTNGHISANSWPICTEFGT